MGARPIPCYNQIFAINDRGITRLPLYSSFIFNSLLSSWWTRSLRISSSAFRNLKSTKLLVFVKHLELTYLTYIVRINSILGHCRIVDPVMHLRFVPSLPKLNWLSSCPSVGILCKAPKDEENSDWPHALVLAIFSLIFPTKPCFVCVMGY